MRRYPLIMVFPLVIIGIGGVAYVWMFIAKSIGGGFEEFNIYVKCALVVYCVQLVVCAYFTSFVAAQKGYSSVNWFISGILFGLIALIAAAGLPKRPLLSKFTKKCPQCGEVIDGHARPLQYQCKYCGQKFGKFTDYARYVNGE